MSNPDGTYFGQIKSGVYTKAKNTETMQMAIEVEVTHTGIGGGWSPVPMPFERTVYLPFTSNAQKYTDSKLIAIGFNGNFDEPGFSEDAMSNGVQIVCKNDVYNGKKSEKWDFAKWDGGELEKASGDAIRQAQAAWKARTGAKPAPPAGGPATPPAAPPRTPAAPPAASQPTPPPASSMFATPPAAAPVTPPAAPAASPAPEAKVMTKALAWAEVSEAWGKSGNSVEDRNAKWVESVSAVLAAVPGKTEDSMTSDDWNRVAEEACIPF